MVEVGEFFPGFPLPTSDYDAPGEPLSLRDAAERLRIVDPHETAIGGRGLVLCSREDTRHPAQSHLARQLGASVHWIDGGHMFPVANPKETAALIAQALRGE